MSVHRGWVLALVVAGCGDDAGSGMVDSAVTQDDAPSQTDGSTMVTCDFTEAADATNGAAAGAEATSLTLATKLTLCGAVNNGHLASGLVDADAFKFTVSADTDVLLRVTGGGLEALTDMDIVIADPSGASVGFGVFEGDHGTLAARLPAGDWLAVAQAFNGSDPAAPTSYVMTVVTDTPATRCAKATGGTTFPEAGDGGSDNGNDVITYDASSNPESNYTAASGDAPEATSFSVAPATQYRITGSSANVNPADDYMDRDTYAFTTGATTNEMSIRLNWAATTVDFDYRVYYSTGATPTSFVGGLLTRNTEDEFETFATTPNTTYWLWVAAYDGATGLPAPYQATLCGESYAP